MATTTTKKKTINEIAPPQINPFVSSNTQISPNKVTQSNMASYDQTKPINPDPRVVNVIHDQETGKLSGIITPSGQPLLGLSPKEVRNLSQKYTGDVLNPPGTVDLAQTQQINQQNQQAQNSAFNQQQQLDQGNQQAMNPTSSMVDNIAAQTQGVNFQQAIEAGKVRGLQGAAVGAVTGATAGLVTAGTLSVPAAAVLGFSGLVGGLVTGIIQNINQQRSTNKSISKDALSQGTQDLRHLTMLAGADPSNRGQYIALFNQATEKIKANQLALEKRAREDPSFYSQNKDLLNNYEDFFSSTGEYNYYKLKMQNTLGNPNVDPFALQELNQLAITQNG